MSDKVKTRYFVLEGENVKPTIDEGVRRHKDHARRVREFVERIGADACAQYSDSLNRGRIRAVAWKAERGSMPAKREGWRFSDEQQGTPCFHLYVSDLRTKVGKVHDGAMRAIGHFDFSTFVCEQLGCMQSFIAEHEGGMAMHLAVAGIVNGTPVAIVPSNDENPFTPPAGFREIRHSEYIAMTEEQSSERQAA